MIELTEVKSQQTVDGIEKVFPQIHVDLEKLIRRISGLNGSLGTYQGKPVTFTYQGKTYNYFPSNIPFNRREKVLVERTLFLGENPALAVIEVEGYLKTTPIETVLFLEDPLARGIFEEIKHGCTC